MIPRVQTSCTPWYGTTFVKRYFCIFISYFFFWRLMAWAASTMNQSDIRGLSWAIRTEPTVIFFVASFAFYEHEFSPFETGLSYRMAASSFVVPTLSSIIKHLRRRADKRKIDHQAASFVFFLAWYCVTANHMNPASSLATAIFALHAILPLFTRYRCRLLNLRPAASAISIAHCGCPFLRFLSSADGTYLCR